jgi:hypothetical protein
MLNRNPLTNALKRRQLVRQALRHLSHKVLRLPLCTRHVTALRQPLSRLASLNLPAATFQAGPANQKATAVPNRAEPVGLSPSEHAIARSRPGPLPPTR